MNQIIVLSLLSLINKQVSCINILI